MTQKTLGATLDHVTFRVADRTLLRDIELTVLPGTLTAVIGPNGAGKTTLLRLLAGDIAPTEGTVRYGDEEIGRLRVPERAKLRSMLSQGHTTDISFTVEQIVAMGRYPYRFDTKNQPGTDRAAVDEAINALELSEYRTRQVRSLSGGEQQRVAIARVLAQQAPLLLLDEPTTALDIRHQESVMALIGGLMEHGHTVVAVLHDLNLATYFDQVVLLDKGETVATGTPENVLTSDVLSTVHNHPIDVVDHPMHKGSLILPRRTTSPLQGG